MTYCENSAPNEITLKGAPEEIAFVLDLVNSIHHPIATKLRKHLEPVVKSHDRFQLCIERKKDWCPKCNGDGNIMVGTLFNNNRKNIEPCHKCDGVGYRVKITTIRYEPYTELFTFK